MTIRKSLLGQVVILAIAILYGLVIAPSMPNTVPIHWDLQGQPDGWGSKWINLGMGPGLVLMNIVLTFVLPLISPRQFEIARFSRTFGTLMLIMSGLWMFMYIIILHASLPGSNVDLVRLIVVGLFLFFALMGNLLGKVRRNFFVGIRTPWTLADERVWEATHRYAGRLWFAGGLLGAILVAIGLSLPAAFVLIVVLALVPAVWSFFLYRRLVA
jgi:uncharacterized membrane protein